MMDALQNPAWFVNFVLFPKIIPCYYSLSCWSCPIMLDFSLFLQWATLDFALVYWHTLFLLLTIFFLLSLQVVTSVSFLGPHLNINTSERSLLVFLLLSTHTHTLLVYFIKLTKLTFFCLLFKKFYFVYLPFCNVNSLRPEIMLMEFPWLIEINNYYGKSTFLDSFYLVMYAIPKTHKRSSQ